MITQLQLEQLLPLLDGQNIKRRLSLLSVRTRNLAKSKLRKSRIASLAWYRRQYFLATAHSEMKTSIRRNEDIFIAISVIAIALVYAYAVLAAELFYVFFMTAFTFSEASGINMMVVTLVAGCTLTITLAWIAAFLLNSMSTAIMHGANRKKARSVKSTLRNGLRYAGRTASSWLLLAAAILVPAIVVGILGLIYSSIFINTQAQFLKILPYLIICAVTGVTYMLSSYSLIPMVAFYEQHLSCTQIMKRSRELVSRKGRLFILSGYVLLTAMIAGTYGLSSTLDSLIGANKTLVFSLMTLIAVVYANGMLTMFYRKRRLARSR